ncbi:hypothetical protein L3Q67_31995 [Saccharothrix sp. AJ9571]|nr:hypothetical protein L3Q67_31995 [Saccharothrix sp. AJ9571]
MADQPLVARPVPPAGTVPGADQAAAVLFNPDGHDGGRRVVAAGPDAGAGTANPRADSSQAGSITAAHAVCYPEIITIASVLASPHWHTVAANPFTENAVYTEIIRRIREGEHPDPFDDTGALWPSSRHPLRYWAPTMPIAGTGTRPRRPLGHPHHPPPTGSGAIRTAVAPPGTG